MTSRRHVFRTAGAVTLGTAAVSRTALAGLLAVGQTRAIEFVAAAGDWAFHCHKSHRTMNAMGHDVPTMIGVDLARARARWTQALR